MRKPHQHFGDVDQFIHRLHERDAGVGDERTHHLPVAGHRAGMRDGGLLRGARTARMQQHDRLALRARARRQLQEAAGLTDLLGDDRDRLGVILFDQMLYEIFRAVDRLVAGRDGECDGHVACFQRCAHHRRHRA